MAEKVSVVFVVEAAGSKNESTGLFLCNLARELTTAKREITFLIDSDLAHHLSDAKHRELALPLKSQNVGYLPGQLEQPPIASLVQRDWKSGVNEFLQRETVGFNKVEWLGAQLPVAFSLRGHWAPQAFGVAAEWGCRTYVDPHSPFENDSKPFFACGRLHLSSLGPFWLDVNWHSLLQEEGISGILEQTTRRAEQLSATGGIMVIRLNAAQTSAATSENAPTAISGFGRLLDRVAALPNVQTVSVRQLTDQFADISYDHAVPMDFFRESATLAQVGELRPIAYEQGYLAPAEQLYGLTAIWHESLQKGKPSRNAKLKFPLGPETRAATDPGVTGIAAEEIGDLLSSLLKQMDGGQLPPVVMTKAGRLSIEDLLPTLAGGFAQSLEPADLPLRRGELVSTPFKPSRFDESLAALGAEAATSFKKLSERQLWTYKPLLGV